MTKSLDDLLAENAFIDSIPTLTKKYNNKEVVEDVAKEKEIMNEFLKDMLDVGVIDSTQWLPEKEFSIMSFGYMKVLLMAHALKIAALGCNGENNDEDVDKLYASFMIHLMATKNVLTILEHLDSGYWNDEEK